MERRFFQTDFLKEKEGRVEGFAVFWDVPNELKSEGLTEVYLRGSLIPFDSGVTLQTQHNLSDIPLANTASKTLLIEDRPQGLFYSAKLPKSRKDVAESVQRGDLTGVSIGFSLEKTTMSGTTMKIEKGILFEISLVSRPALQTTLKLKSDSRARASRRWNLLIPGV